MHELTEAIADNLVYVLVAGCVMVGLVVKALVAVVINWSRERSRREIAAYIAEGSLSADQGERLLRAEVKGDKRHMC